MMQRMIQRTQAYSPRTIISLLTLIVLLAAIFRFIALDWAPSGGHGDVSWIGINALDWVDRGIAPFYVRELYSPEFFPVYSAGILLQLIGVSYLPQRIFTAFFGVIFVILLYPMTYWLLGPEQAEAKRQRAGLLAALAGAISLHIVAMNRLGMESPPFITAVALLTWLTARAWHRHGEPHTWWRWGWAGAALGLAQYIYLPARLLPIMLALWMLHLLLTERVKFWASLRGWIVMAVVSFIVTLPAIIMFLSAPESFTGRADSGSATTGGWIWLYDTSAYGGLFNLFLTKLALSLQGIGISWSGPYTLMNLPILSPVFFVGFLVALGLWLRRPRQLIYVWSVSAIVVLLITDLISGAVPEVHALHQMGTLPFICVLAGVGLAALWDLNPFPRLSGWSIWLSVGLRIILVVGCLLPSLVSLNDYLSREIPAQYADPKSGTTRLQTDVDLSRYLTARSDRAYLLPYSEYIRPDVAWNLAAGFRERRSTIQADGTFRLDSPPASITVIKSAEPARARHDGYPPRPDDHLWVLLDRGAVQFLPPLTEAAVDQLTSAVAQQSKPDAIVDRSGQTIASLYPIATPRLLFAPRQVVQHPVDAVFGQNEVRLLGYSLPDQVPNQDLRPDTGFMVTLYWLPLQLPHEDYEVFAQIWNSRSEAIASAHDNPFSGMYRARIWKTSEVIPTHHWIQIPAGVSPSAYTLVMGLYRYLQNKNVAVSGAQADTALNVVRARDLRVPLPSLPANQIGPALPMPVTFGNTLRLAGLTAQLDGQPAVFDQPEGTLTARAGQTIQFAFDWTALERPTQDYSLFVHLSVAPDVAPSAQFDGLLGGDYTTIAWRKDETIRSMATLTLPADLPAGTYQVLIGVYEWSSGNRLEPLADSAALVGEKRYRLGKLQIK